MNTRRYFSLALVSLSAATAAPALHAASCCDACANNASACASAPAQAQPATLPDTSLYNATGTWQDQDGRTVALRDFAGSPVIVTMVFSHCAYACPRIVDDLRAIREALPENVRSKVRFVLASFDSERDTPERLRAWAAEQKLDTAGPWTLLHGDPDAVRELAVLLDIAYVRQPDGNFAHGNRIVLLDAKGVAVSALEGLGAKPAPIANAAVALVASAR